MKKTISVILALFSIICLFIPAFGSIAADDDLVHCTGWYVGGNDGRVYEIILSPKYVRCADTIRMEIDANRSIKAFNVQKKEIEKIGACFVLYFAWNGPIDGKYILSNSFFDKNGVGNERIRISGEDTFTGLWLLGTDPELSDSLTNEVEMGKTVNITFAQKGTVVLDGVTLAENADSYTLHLDSTGTHTLELSAGGIYTRTIKLSVKTADEIHSRKRAELEQNLRELRSAFWKSIPLALVTLPLAPLFVFGFTFPFAPFEIFGQIMAVKTEIRNLK